MNKKFEKLGFYPADILMPKDCDMTKWAVVACDQFTSEPEYWEAVEKQGLLGALTGGLAATSGGIAAALIFGYLVCLFFRGKPK